MEKIYKVSLGLYTIIVGLLIPITLLLKASSFNRDYYSASFLLFIVLLVGIFVSTLGFQIFKEVKPALKQTLKLTSFVLILIGVVLQIVGSFDLFKEAISSVGDFIVAIIYIVLTLLGLISLLALYKISPK